MISVKKLNSFIVIKLKRSSHSVSVQCVTVTVMKKNIIISQSKNTVALSMTDTESLSSLIADLQLNDLIRKKKNVD